MQINGRLWCGAGNKATRDAKPPSLQPCGAFHIVKVMIRDSVVSDGPKAHYYHDLPSAAPQRTLP